MKRALMAVLVVAVCMAFASGCGKGDDGPGPSTKIKKAKTPVQTLRNMQASMVTGNQKAFIECFDATAQEKEGLKLFCEFVSVAVAFDAAMKKEYGEEAEASGQGMKGSEDMRDTKWLDDAKVDIKGDEATVTRSGDANPVNLVKKGGVWKIKGTSLMGKDLDADSIEKRNTFFRTMIDAQKAGMAKIGKEGYTAKKVQAEVQAAMFGGMMKNMPTMPEVNR